MDEFPKFEDWFRQQHGFYPCLGTDSPGQALRRLMLGVGEYVDVVVEKKISDSADETQEGK